MSHALEFLAEAQAELECVVGDYEARSPGLGAQFRREVERACWGITENPHLWRERPGGYRRLNLARFPYYLAFKIYPEFVLILAVAHASRHPDYWKRRAS